MNRVSARPRQPKVAAVRFPAQARVRSAPMAVEVGQEAPDFTLRDENGEEVALSSLRGRNVVLIFYPLAFSSMCTKELHTITETRRQLRRRRRRGVRHLRRQPVRAEGVQARRGPDARTCSRTSTRRARSRSMYGAYIPEAGIATRATYVIDKDGKVAHKEINNPGEVRDQEDDPRGARRLPGVGRSAAASASAGGRRGRRARWRRRGRARPRRRSSATRPQAERAVAGGPAARDPEAAQAAARSSRRTGSARQVAGSCGSRTTTPPVTEHSPPARP